MVNPPSPRDAARLLSSAKDVELQLENGAMHGFRVVGARGARLTAVCERDVVEPGTSLSSCTLVGEDQLWDMALVVRTVRGGGAATVKAQIEVTRVVAVDRVRRHTRVPVNGDAWMKALHCVDLGSGEMVDGALIDMSRSGVGFAAERELQKGDRLEMHGTVEGERLTVQVEVASVRPSATLGRAVVGCAFVAVSGPTRTSLDRIVGDRAFGRDEPGIDVSSLRRMVEERAARRGFRDRLLRRAS